MPLAQATTNRINSFARNWAASLLRGIVGRLVAGFALCRTNYGGAPRKVRLWRDGRRRPLVEARTRAGMQLAEYRVRAALASRPRAQGCNREELTSEARLQV